MLSPRPAIAAVTRVSDPPDERSRYLCLDKNERVDPWPADHLQGLLGSLSSGDLAQYPVIDPFRTRLAEWAGVDPACLAVTGGSDAAIRAVFDVYGRPGAAVVMPRPTFAMYPVYAALNGMRVHELHYDAELRLPARAVVEAVADVRPALVCLPNPNSPTGTVLPTDGVREILEEGGRHGTAVLVDEAYFHFCPETMLGLVDEFENLIVTRTFSKAGGLAGVRLGFMVSRPRNIDYLRRTKPMYEISALALRCGEYLIAHDDVLWNYARAANEGRALLAARLRTLGFQPKESHTNFLLAGVPDGISPSAIAAALKRRGVLIKGGFADSPLQDCIRVTTASPAVMTRFLGVFEDVWRGLSEGKVPS